MVKKLFKHEWIAYARTLLPFEAVLVGIAIITRFVQFFENDSVAYAIVNGSSIIMLCIAAVVCLVLALVFGITRFYRNLFTNEGYLSFTLPVTPAQHILVKLVVSTVTTLVTVLVIVLSGAIATAGDMFAEIVKAIAYMAQQYFRLTGGVNGAFYIVEALLVLIAGVACEYLLFYGCIALGQTAKKNRVLMSVGVYLIYYVICQVLGTIFIILITVFGRYLPFEQIEAFLTAHISTAVHLGMGIALLIELALCTLYFFVTHHILRKKLNLE